MNARTVYLRELIQLANHVSAIMNTMERYKGDIEHECTRCGDIINESGEIRDGAAFCGLCLMNERLKDKEPVNTVPSAAKPDSTEKTADLPDPSKPVDKSDTVFAEDTSVRPTKRDAKPYLVYSNPISRQSEPINWLLSELDRVRESVTANKIRMDAIEHELKKMLGDEQGEK